MSACERATDPFAELLGAGRGNGEASPREDKPGAAMAEPREFTDKFGVKAVVHDIAYHRNGSGPAEGFYVLRFDWSSERTSEAHENFVAVVFSPQETTADGSPDFEILERDEPNTHEPRVSLLSVSLLPEIGVANRWRGDMLVRVLYQALAEYTRPQA